MFSVIFCVVLGAGFLVSSKVQNMYWRPEKTQAGGCSYHALLVKIKKASYAKAAEEVVRGWHYGAWRQRQHAKI